jgi:hypothetical protein
MMTARFAVWALAFRAAGALTIALARSGNSSCEWLRETS